MTTYFLHFPEIIGGARGDFSPRIVQAHLCNVLGSAGAGFAFSSSLGGEKFWTEFVKGKTTNPFYPPSVNDRHASKPDPKTKHVPVVSRCLLH